MKQKRHFLAKQQFGKHKVKVGFYVKFSEEYLEVPGTIRDEVLYQLNSTSRKLNGLKMMLPLTLKADWHDRDFINCMWTVVVTAFAFKKPRFVKPMVFRNIINVTPEPKNSSKILR